MRKDIKIGDSEMGMVANAASPILYRQIFHEDFLKTIYADGNASTDQIEVFQKMAFIMAKQAEAADGEITREQLYNLTPGDMIEWAESIGDPMAFVNAITDISNLYFGSGISLSSPKNSKGGGRKGRTRQASTSSDAQS